MSISVRFRSTREFLMKRMAADMSVFARRRIGSTVRNAIEIVKTD